MDNGNGGGDFVTKVPPHRERPHYHGDKTRVIFVVSALVLIVAKSTVTEFPLSTFGTVVSAVVLVISAGITNPIHQFGIHWLNAILAMLGAIIFGTAAVEHYRAGLKVFDSSFVYVEALALLSLMALYFTTRTIRGVHQRHEY